MKSASIFNKRTSRFHLENLYRHQMGFICTQQLKTIADECKCYWLLRDTTVHNLPFYNTDPGIVEGVTFEKIIGQAGIWMRKIIKAEQIINFYGVELKILLPDDWAWVPVNYMGKESTRKRDFTTYGL